MSMGGENDKSNHAELLFTWRNRAIRANLGHYRASSFYRALSAAFTCFNLVSAIAVLFLANNKLVVQFFNGESSIAPDFITAVASLFVVLTTALQYVLKLEQKTDAHKNAGNDFTSIKRRIEIFLVGGRLDDGHIEEIALMHTHTSKNYPLVPNFLWRRIESAVNDSINGDIEFTERVRRHFGLAINSTQVEKLVKK
jgi:hypothetical protein